MRRIMDEKFKIVGEEQKTTVHKDYTDIPRWKDILYRFTRNKGSVLGMTVILLVIIFALLGPLHHLMDMMSEYKMPEHAAENPCN